MLFDVDEMERIVPSFLILLVTAVRLKNRSLTATVFIQMKLWE